MKINEVNNHMHSSKASPDYLVGNVGQNASAASE